MKVLFSSLVTGFTLSTAAVGFKLATTQDGECVGADGVVQCPDLLDSLSKRSSEVISDDGNGYSLLESRQVNVGKVEVVNTQTLDELGTYSDGDRINVERTEYLTLKYLPSTTDDIESVKFYLNDMLVETEVWEPYYFNGNMNDSVFAWNWTFFNDGINQVRVEVQNKGNSEIVVSNYEIRVNMTADFVEGSLTVVKGNYEDVWTGYRSGDRIKHRMENGLSIRYDPPRTNIDNLLNVAYFIDDVHVATQKQAPYFIGGDDRDVPKNFNFGNYSGGWHKLKVVEKYEQDVYVTHNFEFGIGNWIPSFESIRSTCLSGVKTRSLSKLNSLKSAIATQAAYHGLNVAYYPDQNALRQLVDFVQVERDNCFRSDIALWLNQKDRASKTLLRLKGYEEILTPQLSSLEDDLIKVKKLYDTANSSNLKERRELLMAIENQIAIICNALMLSNEAIVEIQRRMRTLTRNIAKGYHTNIYALRDYQADLDSDTGFSKTRELWYQVEKLDKRKNDFNKGLKRMKDLKGNGKCKDCENVIDLYLNALKVASRLKNQLFVDDAILYVNRLIDNAFYINYNEFSIGEKALTLYGQLMDAAKKDTDHRSHSHWSYLKDQYLSILDETKACVSNGSNDEVILDAKTTLALFHEQLVRLRETTSVCQNKGNALKCSPWDFFRTNWNSSVVKWFKNIPSIPGNLLLKNHVLKKREISDSSVNSTSTELQISDQDAESAAIELESSIEENKDTVVAILVSENLEDDSNSSPTVTSTVEGGDLNLKSKAGNVEDYDEAQKEADQTSTNCCIL